MFLLSMAADFKVFTIYLVKKKVTFGIIQLPYLLTADFTE